MKKVVALLLALSMVFALCACGGSPSGAIIEETLEDETVEFEDVILINNEIVTIELVNFFIKTWGTGDSAQKQKCFSIKAKNNSNHVIILNPTKAYIGDEEVKISMLDGSINLDPGKYGFYSYQVCRSASPTDLPLESIDELRSLAVTFQGLNKYEDSSKNTSLEVAISIARSLNGDSLIGSEEETVATVLHVGETAVTDMVELTLNEYAFSNVVSLDHSNWLNPTDENRGLSAGKDKVFVWISFTVKNLSKKELSGYDVCTAIVDYNDGYRFEQNEFTGTAGWSTSAATTKNVGLPKIQPLETRVYSGLIKCAAEVAENSQYPLYVVFSLPSSGGTIEIHYLLTE